MEMGEDAVGKAKQKGDPANEEIPSIREKHAVSFQESDALTEEGDRDGNEEEPPKRKGVPTAVFFLCEFHAGRNLTNNPTDC